MAGGTNQWPPEGGMGRPGFVSGGPDDPAMGGSGYYSGGQGGGWGGDYGFKAKQAVMPEGWQSGDPNPWNPGGPNQWAGPNAIYPNWNDDPSSGYANDVALINAGPWPGGDGGGWGGPWTGGGGGFGPGLMWDVQDGPGSGMWNEPEGGYDEYVEPVVEEEAAPFNWGSVGAGRLAKAKEYAALGKMGRAKNVFTSGKKGGAWSPEIAQQLRTFKTGG